MITISLSTGGRRHDVNTVRGRQSTAATGSGTIKFVPQRKGGAFNIEATASSGSTISGVVKCEAFATPTPVAG
jgi:hypothetical protein